MADAQSANDSWEDWVGDNFYGCGCNEAIARSACRANDPPLALRGFLLD